MAKRKIHIKALARYRIRSVSIRLSISVLVTVICVVAALSSISFYSFKNAYEQKVAAASAQTMEIAGKKVDQMLVSFMKMSQTLENNQDFVNRATHYQTAEQDSYDESALNSQIQGILESLLNVHPSIRSISIISEGTHPLITTADLKTLSTVFLDTDKSKMKENGWYKQIQSEDGNIIWLQPQDDPMVTMYQNERIYAMGKMLKSPLSKKNLGALVVEVSTDSLAETLDGIEIGPSGENLIVDSKQVVIYAEDQSLIGTQYQGSLPSLKEQEEGIQTGSFTKKGEHGNNLYVYSYLPDSAWFLLSYAPKSKLLADMRQMQSFILWVALILAGFSAVLIGFLVRRSIGKPLNRISALMEQGEQGNLQIRTHSQRFDQIGEMERSFDRMMDHITLLVQQANRSTDAVMHTAEGLIRSSKSTSVASHDISAAMTQITQGAIKVAEEAELGNSLTIQNSDRIVILNSSNEKLERLGQHLKEASNQGQEYMTNMLDQTEEVEFRTKHLIEQAAQLREGTDNIEKIVQLLGNISKQTSILSLNATIEASRAGSAGKGFMVIAEEIRKLADQSKGSLDMVSEVISGIVQDSENTVTSLAELQPTLSRQTESIHQSKEIFERLHQEVASVMDQLSTVQHSVSQLEESQNSLSMAMESVSSISEETSAASQEVLALSHNQMAVSSELSQLSTDLSSLAEELHKSLSHFKL